MQISAQTNSTVNMVHINRLTKYTDIPTYYCDLGHIFFLQKLDKNKNSIKQIQLIKFWRYKKVY